MAVDSYESTTGRPIFLDSGAPDIAVDPTAVGIYAAEVGNRIVKANLAALNSYTYRRAGLMGRALDTGTEYIHNGTGWVKVLEDTGWITLPLTGSWLNFGTPYRDAQYRRVNGEVMLRGNIKSGNTGAVNPIATLPVGFRPVTYDEQFLIIANVGIGDLRVDSSGRVYVATYYASGNNGVVSLNPVRFFV